ncbi:outer membrane beta-barrel protein [Pontibacter rugosus]
MAEAREEYIEEIEPGFSFGVEVKTGFKIGKKWKLLSGLGFTQNTARSKSSYVIEQFQNEPNRSGKVSAGPSAIFLSSLDNSLLADSVRVGKTDKYNVHYRYRHLTVPAGIQYEGKLSNDWFWFAGGGVAANILLESAVLASSAEVRDSEYTLSDEESPFRKLQWSGNVTAGVGKRLSNNISVAVGPAFKGYLSSMLANPDRTNASQGRPYNIGLNMAVNYDLGAGSR